MTNSRPAFRKDDTGIHAACCNTNTWKAVQGSGTVFINNKEAVRLGDQTKHCGGSGNMIEGSDNVMIGGAAGSGGGGGSGGGSSSGQAGGGTDGGSGSQSGINSNQTGSGGGGGAGGAGGAAGGAASTSDGGGGAGGAGGAAGSSTSANPTKDPEKDSFALWLELAAVNGGKLIGEIIEIIDPETKEVIATQEVGEEGNVFVEVPKNKPYDVQVRHTDHEPLLEPNSDDDFHMDQLALDFLDEDGIPLATGTEVKVTGNGVKQTTHVGFGGHVIAILDPGTYEIEVAGQKFVADTINGLEAKHPGFQPYQFILPAKKEKK